MNDTRSTEESIAATRRACDRPADGYARLLSMAALLAELGFRFRIIVSRLLVRIGLREDSFLLIPAFLIGMVTAAAAVGFHELILFIRDLLYHGIGPVRLYGTWMWLLVLFPALGGLVVGAVSTLMSRGRQGHGVVDVMESVVRSSGFQKPAAALEKIFTSAITIGSGGSAGAEGPIVQIGAAISSGIGSLFRIARHQMPVLVGCGSAAGISAIFNAPIGGVLFTLEVILQDFSIRTLTPVIVASVIANVTTRAIFAWLDPTGSYEAIFAMSRILPPGESLINWGQIGNFVLLGLLCGLVGAALTRLMASSEARFKRLERWRAIRPAIGGAMVGVLGVVYVLIFGRLLLGTSKPFDFDVYPMPAFFGDGYGVIEALLQPGIYAQLPLVPLLLLLAFLCLIKIVATCLTLASGGSGGIIAPSLFMGATAGGFLGTILQRTGMFSDVRPELYALVGMGAALAAVVHAPLASILILFELTQDYRVTLPAMLTVVFATGAARLIAPDSIYTQALRSRGLKPGAAGELSNLRRLSVEQIRLEPASVVQLTDPFQRVLDLSEQMNVSNFIVLDKHGTYRGMITTDDINTALTGREAVPLLLVQELLRADLPIIQTTDDLARVFELFLRHDVDHLPVCLPERPGKPIGLISRASVMRHYYEGR